ncbi:MAG: RNA-binding S4 domain-containing protein [Rhodocyclaceae bacterium]|nr:RNA-binding S4 domain-containing protein [Rhodocyclaceae bacterium]
MRGHTSDPLEHGGVRLDVWLHAARFFKHRSEAAAAADGGKVHVNGLRAKPAKNLVVGDRLDIQLPGGSITVILRATEHRRGPAEQARKLYEETPESIARREALREQRRLAADPGAASRGRPSKNLRRALEKFRRSATRD